MGERPGEKGGILHALWETVPLKGGLGRRILLWFLVLSLVPLLLSNTVGYRVTRKIIQGQTGRYLTALADVEALHVAAELERHQLYLDAVVAGNRFLVRRVPEAAAEVRSGERGGEHVNALHEHLDRKLMELRPLAELVVLDCRGQVVGATRHNRIGSDWSEGELFRVGRSGHFFAESSEFQQGKFRPIYRLATPIRDDDGTCVGVLSGVVEFDMLREFLRISPHLAGDVHTYIVDRTGRPLVVSHQHVPIDYAKRLRSPLIEAPARAVARYDNYEGEEVFGTSVIIPGLEWRYIAEVSVTSAFGTLRVLALLAAALESIFALLLVAVVWIVARSIVSPLHRLVAAAERIRKGELGVEVQIERDDELGDLGRTFDQMSNELEVSAQRIRELHDQQMQRAAQLASVGELASGIAHEIKNPLVGVASGIDLLSEMFGENGKSRRILSQIRAQVHRMDVAIQDLLSYARPKEPRLIWADPGQLVDRTIALVQPQAEAAGVRIAKKQTCSIPKIRVDPDLLTQALVNLALNGIQAMGEGGTLEVKLDCLEEEVGIAIADSGTGIAPDQIEEIFRPFHTTKHEGSGLGLAITRGIIERHGGRLEVQSTVGEGSVFTLVIAVTDQKRRRNG